MKTKTISFYSFDKTDNLSLSQTLDCGQCFRWHIDENSKWHGIIGKNAITLYIDGENLIALGAENEKQIFDYFDFNLNYKKLKNELSLYPPLKSALNYAEGIRILRQDFFETLITFILSQNNNIPRIKGLVEALCSNFGEPIGDGIFAFPSCEKLSQLTVEDLSIIKCGFRARYIIDAANKVNHGIVNYELLSSLPLEKAEEHLMKIVGVGKKVADCTLLFGCHRLDAFPVDVWIKRALHNFFPNGLDQKLSPIGGIAQQFLFHYIRTSPETENIRLEEKRLRQEEKQLKKEKKAKS